MIYLDYAATTPLAPEALAAMQPYFTDLFANPASDHGPGRAAKKAVERARAQIHKVGLRFANPTYAG